MIELEDDLPDRAPRQEAAAAGQDRLLVAGRIELEHVDLIDLRLLRELVEGRRPQLLALCRASRCDPPPQASRVDQEVDIAGLSRQRLAPDADVLDPVGLRVSCDEIAAITLRLQRMHGASRAD